MATDSIEVTAVIPASAAHIYAAWLDSEGHTAMTGGGAVIDPAVGGEHTAWDGYISGVTTALEAGRRIEQSWYATNFPAGSAHSLVVVTIEDEDEGDRARVRITHSEIPEGMGASYESGWQDHYFTPMMAYFETGGAEGGKAKKKAVAKKAVARKPVARKPVAKKAVATKKTVATKKAVAKTPAKKVVAKKSAAKQVAKKKPAAKKKAANKRA